MLYCLSNAASVIPGGAPSNSSCYFSAEITSLELLGHTRYSHHKPLNKSKTPDCKSKSHLTGEDNKIHAPSMYRLLPYHQVQRLLPHSLYHTLCHSSLALLPLASIQCKVGAFPSLWVLRLFQFAQFADRDLLPLLGFCGLAKFALILFLDMDAGLLLSCHQDSSLADCPLPGNAALQGILCHSEDHVHPWSHLSSLFVRHGNTNKSLSLTPLLLASVALESLILASALAGLSLRHSDWLPSRDVTGIKHLTTSSTWTH